MINFGKSSGRSIFHTLAIVPSFTLPCAVRHFWDPAIHIHGGFHLRLFSFWREEKKKRGWNLHRGQSKAATRHQSGNQRGRSLNAPPLFFISLRPRQWDTNRNLWAVCSWVPTWCPLTVWGWKTRRVVTAVQFYLTVQKNSARSLPGDKNLETLPNTMVLLHNR